MTVLGGGNAARICDLEALEAVARRNAQILQKRRTATPCGVTVLGGDNATRICDLTRWRRLPAEMHGYFKKEEQPHRVV